MSSNKQLPNIIICGTPGVGKSRLCQELCSTNKSFNYININDLAKKNKYFLEYDEENQCEILNDDVINDYLNDEYFEKSSSGLIIDYHSAGIISDNNHIHGIFVLHCNPDKLNERLKTGNYLQKKIEQYIQAEDFKTCLNEAREAFDETIVHQLYNNTDEDLKKNVDYLLKWIDQWPFNETME